MNKKILGTVMVTVMQQGQPRTLTFRVGHDQRGYFIQANGRKDYDATLHDDEAALKRGMMTIGKIIHDAYASAENESTH